MQAAADAMALAGKFMQGSSLSETQDQGGLLGQVQVLHGIQSRVNVPTQEGPLGPEERAHIQDPLQEDPTQDPEVRIQHQGQEDPGSWVPGQEDRTQGQEDPPAAAGSAEAGRNLATADPLTRGSLAIADPLTHLRQPAPLAAAAAAAATVAAAAATSFLMLPPPALGQLGLPRPLRLGAWPGGCLTGSLLGSLPGSPTRMMLHGTDTQVEGTRQLAGVGVTCRVVPRAVWVCGFHVPCGWAGATCCVGGRVPRAVWVGGCHVLCGWAGSTCYVGGRVPRAM